MTPRKDMTPSDTANWITLRWEIGTASWVTLRWLRGASYHRVNLEQDLCRNWLLTQVNRRIGPNLNSRLPSANPVAFATSSLTSSHRDRTRAMSARN